MVLHLLGHKMKGRWKKALGGLVVATLLLPLPAFAGGFLGNWTVAQKQTGTAPPATANADFFFNGGALAINLGTYANVGSSTVIGNNYFWVDNPSELLTITDGFQTKMKDSTLKFDVILTPLASPGMAPGQAFWTPPVNQRARLGPKPITYNDTSATYLTGGLYMVTIKIKSENKNRFAVTKDASPFTITFNGI